MAVDHQVLAFDLGASSGRAFAGKYTKLEGKEPILLAEEIHRFPNGAVEVGHHLHWDILRLLEEVKTGIRIAFQQGWEPKTFGIDTWGVDFGLLDACGELIGNPYHYRDPQTEKMVAKVTSQIGEQTLYEQTGLQQMPFNTIYQLAAMRHAVSPKLDIAKTLLFTPDLLVYFLTGEKVCEYTMATTSQLFHPLKRKWNKKTMERLNIPLHLFLDVIEPGKRIAPLSAKVCEELNVPAIDAVAVATHDTESAIAAVPAEEESFIYLVCGTWSLFGTERDAPMLTEEARLLDFSNEGGAGGKFQLLKNIMGLWILQECKREWDAQGEAKDYSLLVSEARRAQPFRSLIHPDDFRFYSPHDMVSKIQSFCKETGQPIPESTGEITRCVIESLALRYRQAIEQLEQLTGESYERLHMVGGGIQNELLCELTANAISRSVWAGPSEASALGNMLLQLMAEGLCSDLREARRLIARSFPVRVYEPSQDAKERSGWEQAYRRFLQLDRK